jgi:ABC-type multidrug transport system fused ATPase/permease subunit
MFQNIILLVLVILLLFFISNEKKLNDLFSKNNIKYLFLLIIVYFIYQNYNLILLIIAILIVIYFNVDFSERFNNNKYFEMFKGIKEKFSNFSLNEEDNEEKKENIEPFREKVTNIKNLFDNIKMEIKKIV